MPIVASYYRARYYDPSARRFVLEETAYSGKVIEVKGESVAEARFAPRGRLGTRARGAVVCVKTAVYSGKAIICGNLPGVPCRGNGIAAQAGTRRTGLVMSEPFRPYEKLVEISVFGKKFQVPERNSLLRCFQFISPETIPYGRFCWNQDCQREAAGGYACFFLSFQWSVFSSQEEIKMRSSVCAQVLVFSS